MDSDTDIVRFEILLPRSMRMQLAAIAARQRRTHSAEAVIAIARHIAAESRSVASAGVLPGSWSADQGHNGAASLVTPGEAAPTPECAGGSDAAGASPSGFE